MNAHSLIAAIVAVLTTLASASDILPPDLTEFAFTPQAVNITAASQTITFTGRFVDNLSGTDWPTEVRFRSPSGAQDIYPTFDSIDRISGTATDGVFQETFTLPRYSETGVWTVVSLTLADAVGNRTEYQGADAVSYFTSRGFPYQVTVTGTADLVPPALTEFAFTPQAVNITAASQTITFTGRFVDNLSGTDWPTEVRFRSPSGAQDIYPTFDSIDRISGTATDGMFQETFTLPRYSETGVWTVVSLTLADAVGNRTEYQGADAVSYFTSRGFPYQVTVTGTADLVPPSLTELDFTPKVVNVTTASQTITFTGRFVDNLSGTDWPTEVRFSSPSGAQDVYPTFDSIDRISGTVMDGVFQETFTLPQFSETGVWTLVSLTLADTAGNRTEHYGADAVSYFSNRGFPYQFVVVEDFRLVPSIQSNQTFQLQWPSISDVRYMVEWKSDLANSLWNSTADTRIGNGGILSWQTGISGVTQRFFRVIVLPP